MCACNGALSLTPSAGGEGGDKGIAGVDFDFADMKASLRGRKFEEAGPNVARGLGELFSDLLEKELVVGAQRWDDQSFEGWTLWARPRTTNMPC